MPSDEERYVAYFSKPDDNADPLDAVRQLRSEQLAVCDVRKHAELAKLRQALDVQPVSSPPSQKLSDK